MQTTVEEGGIRGSSAAITNQVDRPAFSLGIGLACIFI